MLLICKALAYITFEKEIFHFFQKGTMSRFKCELLNIFFILFLVSYFIEAKKG